MQYFKHMSNMRNDVKMKRLISRYGLEGYGLYNLILETITENLCNECPNPILEETNADIAEFYNSDTTKIEEMINFMINQGLFSFEKETNKLKCDKIYKYLEASSTRSEKIRKLIKLYKEFSKQLEIEVSQMSQTKVTKSEEKNRIEKNRIEKNINTEKKIKIKFGDSVSMTQDEYHKLLNSYGENDTKKMIEILDNYKGANGKTYKSDYKAILSWVVKRYNEDQQKEKNGNVKIFKTKKQIMDEEKDKYWNDYYKDDESQNLF